MIRPSVKIGEYCILGDVWIGENTVLKNYVELRDGTVIGKDCYIDSGVCVTGECNIGDRVTIRNKVTVARGSEIGDDTFIAPHVMFNNLDSEGKKIGGAKIGKNCFIGTSTVLHHGITICDDVTIGAKSFVNKDITEPGKYIGCPAKKV